jgi:hypothetical protein
MAWPLSISSAVVRLSAVRDDYPIEEPQMQFDDRRAADLQQRPRTGSFRAGGATLFSHSDFRNSTIAC